VFDHQPNKPRHSTFQVINCQVGSGALMAANPDLQIVQYGQCGHHPHRMMAGQNDLVIAGEFPEVSNRMT